MTALLTAKACSFWQRQETRSNRDAATDPLDMPLEQAEAELQLLEGRDAEDVADPMCGSCPVCVAANSEGDDAILPRSFFDLPPERVT